MKETELSLQTPRSGSSTKRVAGGAEKAGAGLRLAGSRLAWPLRPGPAPDPRGFSRRVVGGTRRPEGRRSRQGRAP